ncbi:MAG TPA: flippase [Chloroflexi bacterium]|nr:flippase [Chloroflexota bacterium]
MNTPRNIFKNTMALFISQIIYMGGSILLVFYLSRLLQAEGLGSYSTALAFFGLGELVCELGLSNFIPRELSKDLTKTNRYLIHAGLLVVAISLVLMVIFAGIVPFFDYADETTRSIYLVSLALIPTALRVILGAIFICHQRAEFVTLTTTLWTTVKILVSLYLLYQGYGVISLILTFTVMSYLSLFTSLGFYIKYINKPRWEFDMTFLKRMAYDLRAFVVLAIGGSIFTQAELLILSWIKGEAEVGIYSAAFKLITIWYVIPTSYMQVVFPILTHTYQKSSRQSHHIQLKSLKYLLALAFPLAVGGFVVAEPVVNLFYGPGFERSVMVFRLIAWHTILAFINNVLWRALLARDEQHLALRVQIISGVIRIVASFLLIPMWGAVGAGMALMTGYTVYTLLHIYYIQRNGMQLPFLKLGGRFALASALMGAFVSVLVTRVNLFVLVLLAALVYVGLVLLLRGFSQEDWALFSQVWRQRVGKKVIDSEPVVESAGIES